MNGQDNLLPFFPLEMVAFPGERLNLHIFEPRYRQLIHHIREQGTTFCIPAVIDRQVQVVATEMKLVEVVKQYEDGRLDIRAEGIGVVETLDFFPMLIGWLFPAGEVRRVETIANGHDLNRLKIVDLVRDLCDRLGASKPVPSVSELESVFAIGHHLGFNLQQEYQLLSTPEELDRQEMVLTHLQQLMPTVVMMDEIRKKVSMNGHFREFPPADWA